MAEFQLAATRQEIFRVDVHCPCGGVFASIDQVNGRYRHACGGCKQLVDLQEKFPKINTKTYNETITETQ